LKDELVGRLARPLGVENEVALYIFIIRLEEVWAANGIKNHMKEGLEGWEELKKWIGREGNAAAWEGLINNFRGLIGDERA
jgi:hypothetical protein